MIRRLINRYDEFKNISYSGNLDQHYAFGVLNQLEKAFVELQGGICSNVFLVEDDGCKKVYKFCSTPYRAMELSREHKVLKYLNEVHLEITPMVYEYRAERNRTRAYLVQEYIEGTDLRTLLKSGISLEQGCDLWTQVGQALKKIHSVYKEKCNEEWLEKQLNFARMNMEAEILDPEEFENSSPSEVFQWLQDNKIVVDELTLLHGDYRTKNIIIDSHGNVQIIDWGFVDIGDKYYDLSIVEYYLSNEEDRRAFYSGYGLDKVDIVKIEYYDKLSKFLNV